MDIFRGIITACFMALLCNEGCSALTLSPQLSANKAILGNNSYTITCEYGLTNGEQIFSVGLSRKSPSQSNYTGLVTYVLTDPTRSPIYADAALKTRTSANLTGTGNYPFLQFSSILCEDKAEYMWKANYLAGASVLEKQVPFNLQVKVPNNFSMDSQAVTVSPSSPIMEGREMTFTCQGDVGNEPAAQLGWYYYMDNATTGGIDISNQADSHSPSDNENRPCSLKRTSTLKMNMTRVMNGVVVRCTVQQDSQNEFGEGYRQTNHITVLYGPSFPTVVADPLRGAFTVGENVTLQCSADANPVASFYWHLPDNSTVNESVLTLTDLTEEQTGEYTCFAYNEIDNVNFTMSHSVSLSITETTTTSTTTPTPITSNPDNNNPGDVAPATGDDDEETKTAIIIGVCVGVGVVIIIVIVVIVCCLKQKRKNVEEPIKVKNNQGLSYSGRPDLVSADYGKNNAQAMNASFNNSFDSMEKPKNEDGLMYLDLTFDDKPRSRRPIQLYDNSPANTSYTDITMPRV